MKTCKIWPFFLGDRKMVTPSPDILSAPGNAICLVFWDL